MSEKIEKELREWANENGQVLVEKARSIALDVNNFADTMTDDGAKALFVMHQTMSLAVAGIISTIARFRKDGVAIDELIKDSMDAMTEVVLVTIKSHQRHLKSKLN